MRAMGMTFGKSSEPSYFAFFEPHKRYHITRFQRAYTWKDYQIRGIIGDLSHIKESGQQVGWPSILIQKSPIKSSTPNVIDYDLGDGQQRVISVSLGLIALWQSAYTKKSMGEITSEEFEYFREIIPEEGFRKSAEGILAKSVATDYGLVLDPTIEFYSKAANETFKSLFTPLQAPFWRSIDDKIASSSDGSGILKAFQIYYEEFKKYSFEQLKNASENLLTKVTLSVLEYESHEDMQRAFANMNSFGVSLTESELVKAKFYGHFKLKDPALAEELASFWTNELESKDWKAVKANTSVWGFSKARKQPLELFLEEFLCLYEDWEIARTRPNRDDNPRNNNEHWLRDSWGECLMRLTDISKFWSQFKQSVEIFKTANSLKAFTPGTLEWEINYSYQILGKVMHFPSILMKLNLAMSEQDFRKSLILLQKYYMYLNFVTDESRNLNQSILKAKTPILKWEITYEEFADLIETTTAPKSQWRSKEYIESFLSEATYKNKMNSDMCELFIYAINEEKRSKGMLNAMFNTKTYVEGAVRSREHILPQTPRESMSPNEKAIYDLNVERLGNSLVLSTDLNSSASNRSVKDKIKIYEDSKLSPWGLLWVEDFLKDYREAGKWESDEIDRRSRKLAKIFSQYLAPENPYSEFRELLKVCKAGDEFWNLDSEEPYCLTLTSNGLLEDLDGIQFGSFRDIRASKDELSIMRSLVLYRIDDSDTPFEMITLNLDKPAKFEQIEEVEKSENRTLMRFAVVSKLFGKIEDNHLRRIYSEYVKLSWTHDKGELIRKFSIKTGIAKTSEISSNRLDHYMELDSGFSFYNVFNREYIFKKIETIAQIIGDTIEIGVVNSNYVESNDSVNGLFGANRINGEAGIGEYLTVMEANEAIRTRSEVSVSTQSFKMTGISFAKIYASFMKMYWVENKDVMIDLFSNPYYGIIRSNLIPEEKQRSYSELDSDYSICSNKNRHALANDIDLLCVTLNEPFTITGVDYK